MPVIDLKNVTIEIVDGYNGGDGWLINLAPLTGFVVNNASGYMAGASTIAVDLGTGILKNGFKFTIAGETGTPVHTISSHTETLGSTTSITFSPVLAGSVADEAAITVLSSYGTGDGTIAVDGGTGALVTGDTFTIPSETGTPVHTISSHTETLGNTTSITFTATLASGIADDAAITVRPHRLAVKIGEGNMTYDEKRNIEYKKDRGLLDQTRLGDQDPVEVKFDFQWDWLRSEQSTDPPTPEEAVKRIGNASTWVSSDSDKCQPYAVDIVLTNAPSCPGATVKTEVITLPLFRWESLNHDPKQGQIALTGKCNVIQANVARV